MKNFSMKKVYNAITVPISIPISMPDIQVKKRNYGHLTLKFLALILVGSLISFYLYYVILDFEIRRNISLRPKAIVRYIYMNLPFPLTLKIYIFNVLNKDEVQNGGKPHLKEIGPFVFHEYVKKVNATDYNSEDALEFTTIKTYIFRPELSHGLTGEEIVTTLHPVINSIGLVVQTEQQQFMHVAIAAINELFHKPTDAFWTGRAMDLLYDGINIDCSSKDPLARLACREIKNSANSQIQQVNETTFKFSMLGGLNNKTNGVYKILRGRRYPRELGKIVTLDGKEEMNVWKGDRCNNYRGTDGLIFPPFQTIDEPVTFFVKQLCMNFDLRYKEKTYLRGIRMRMFTYDIGNIARDDERLCYCRDPHHCPINGTIDLQPCIKVPIIGTLPHFLNADPSLIKNISSGLEPSVKNHSFTINMELRTGIPLAGAGRFQLNFDLQPVPQIEVMSKLPKMIFPFVWFEEGADVPDGLVNLLKYTLIFGTGLNRCLQYISLTVGPVGFIVCFTIFLMTKFNVVKVQNEARHIQVNGISDVGITINERIHARLGIKRDRRLPLSARSLDY